MMFLNSGIGITYQTPTNQNNTILRNVLLSGAPKFLLLLGSNKSSVHYLFEFEDGEDGEIGRASCRERVLASV